MAVLQTDSKCSHTYVYSRMLEYTTFESACALPSTLIHIFEMGFNKKLTRSIKTMGQELLP
jgi:hypothetical protein